MAGAMSPDVIRGAQEGDDGLLLNCHWLEVTLKSRVLTNGLSLLIGCDSVTQDERNRGEKRTGV
jgi:hypothetical protein